MSIPIPMIFTSIPMDCPLNQAHKHERIGQEHLHHGQWDEAEKSFSLAAKLMKEAMAGVTKKKVKEPMELQIRKLEDMKNVIEIKRKETSCEHPSTKDQKQYGYYESGNNGISGNEVEKTSAEKIPKIFKKPENEQKKENNNWQLVPCDIQQLIEEREHDSLLQFLNLPDPLNSSSSFKKIPKDKDSIIEEYKEQNNLLREAAMGFWKELEKTERENKTLREQIDKLESDVWSLNEKLQIIEDAPPPTYNDESPRIINRPQLGLDNAMIASIIVQPESFFEFEENEKDLSTELQLAAEEEFFENKGKNRMKSGENFTMNGNKRHKPRPGTYLLDGYVENSIKYEDLDDECNTEVSESTSEMGSASTVTSQRLQFDTAGLPPLSPVHFEFEENKDINGDQHRGDLSGKLS